MWILILTLVTTSHTHAAIASVPGFTSEQACLAAGNAWLKHELRYSPDKRALCVKA